MNQVEKFRLKNANRKAARADSGWQGTQARRMRQAGFIGKEGTCLNGAFGQVSAGKYNELVVGTTGGPRELKESDIES